MATVGFVAAVMAGSDSDSDYQEPETLPIIRAAEEFDVEALRRELESGDWDMSLQGGLALYLAVLQNRSRPEVRLQERLECISMLLEAGASQHLKPLQHAVGTSSPLYHAVITLLMEAGADVNAIDPFGYSMLAKAAKCGTAAAVRTLISAGAVDLDQALEDAITGGKIRNCAPLMRAGAAIPAVLTAPDSWENVYHDGFPQACDYIEKIDTAGGYKAYEKAHRQRLTAIFLPKFPALPVEMLGRILEFTWDIGGH